MSTDLDDFFDMVGDVADTAADATKEAQIEDLVARLTKASHDYYNGTPSMTDAEYDKLEEELRALDSGNAFFKRVGAAVDKSPWQKVQHRSPMGSLKKVQTPEEFREWASEHARAGKTFVLSDKCDGISLALWYEDGDLVMGVTRGDGLVGEDITRNARRMKGVRTNIPGFTGELRAEVVLLHEDWQKHFPDKANPRNAASGTAKRLDGVGVEHLTVLHYQMIRRGGKVPIRNKIQEFKALKALGCAVPRFYEASDAATVLAIYEKYIAGVRGRLNYDIDGLVIEFDDLEYAESLGFTNERPNGARAFKFPHMRKPSVLQDIIWQVGPTGRTTPVAIFDQVNLAGANVSRASLYNISYIENDLGGLRQGDKVIVSRRNDVIPRVEEVEARNPSGQKFEAPGSCPECDTRLVMDGEFLMCPNSFECPAQVSGMVKHWIDGLGLKGWGDSIVVALCEEGYVSSPADLYYLKAEEVADIRLSGSRIGSTADKIIPDLHANKSVMLHVFVGSLGIPMIGKSLAKSIVDAGFDTLEKMRDATVSDIMSIDKMGEAKARSFVAGISERESLIDALLDAGVTIQPPATGPLKGLSVCMTGFRDPSMERAIEAAGGTVKSGVSKTLSILVAADPNSQTGKAKKARDYGVRIMGEDDMWQMLGGRT